MLQKRFFLKSAIIVTIATLLSKMLGLIRQQYGLYFFGGGWEYDSFVAAFRIPNALRELLAEGALSAAFIPLFASLLAKGNKDNAFRFANKILTLSVILSLIAVVIGIISSSSFMQYYHNNPDKQGSTTLAIEMFNILMIYLPFISVSAIFMGMLNSLDVFFIPSLGPFVSNVFFLIVLFTLYSVYGINTLAYSLIAGGIAYMIIQIPFLYKKGFRFKPSINFSKDPYIKDFIRLFIPFALALGIPKLNNILSNIYSDAITGANTALAQGFFMIQLPISIFVVSVSTVSLPTMSKQYENKQIDELVKLILVGLRMVFIFTMPAMIGFMLLSDDISAFIYKDIVMLISNGSIGAINDTVIRNIAHTTYYFAPSIVSIGFAVILIRAFQSIRSMWILIYSSLVSVFVHLALMSLFINTLSLPFYTIALSISIASFVNLFLLMLFLKKKLTGFKINKNTLHSIIKTLLASAIMGLFLFFLKDTAFTSFFSKVYVNSIVNIMLTIVLSVLFYFTLLYLFKEEGFKFFVDYIYKKIMPNKKN